VSRRALWVLFSPGSPLNHFDGLLLFSGVPKKRNTTGGMLAPENGSIWPLNRRNAMKKENELAIKVTKEIVVKFIEAGRLSVSSFQEVWEDIHRTVNHSIEMTKNPED